MDARAVPLGKSRFGHPSLSQQEVSDRVAFETDDVEGTAIDRVREASLERTIFSIGDPRQGPPSRLGGDGARFELNIWFYLHNQFAEDTTIRDIKTHVYHLSTYPVRPLTIPLAPRVELAYDNLADLNLVARVMKPGIRQPIQLVFETSVFDTLFTTIIFGLTVNYSFSGEPHVVYRIPSDKIFVFQHDHSWGPSRCHFVSRSSADFDDDRFKSPEYVDLVHSARTIFNLHCNRPAQIVRDDHFS